VAAEVQGRPASEVEKIGEGEVGRFYAAMTSGRNVSKQWPNTSFQRTLTRGEFGPQNSDR
jgi:hypothetical protein